MLDHNFKKIFRVSDKSDLDRNIENIKMSPLCHTQTRPVTDGEKVKLLFLSYCVTVILIDQKICTQKRRKIS